MARRDEGKYPSRVFDRAVTKPGGFCRENAPGGGPFDFGLRCRERYSPLRGCSARYAAPKAKIPRRSTSPNFQAGSWHFSQKHANGFVPLPYQPENDDIPVKTPSTGFNVLRTLAVSRSTARLKAVPKPPQTPARLPGGCKNRAASAARSPPLSEFSAPRFRQQGAMNPNGIPPQSPRVDRAAGCPGKSSPQIHQP